MQQKVTDTLRLSSCYRIDSQFLLCVDDILKKTNPDVSYHIKIQCNNVIYTFDDLDEFMEYTKTLTTRITQLYIRAFLPCSLTSNTTNEVEILFNNRLDSTINGEIEFNFNDERDYLVLKNQLETLLKNYRLNYSFFAKIPIITCLDIISFIGLCVYTNIRSIIFPKIMQSIIWICFFMLLIIFNLLPPARKAKRYLFPLNEFCFGANIALESNARSFRNTLGISIILSILVGIMVNIITNLII